VHALSAAVATQSAEAKNVVSTVQTAYSAKEQELVKSFTSTSEVQEKAHATLLEQLRAAAKIAEEAAARTSSELIKALETDRNHAKEIVGIIGNIGVTGNYKATAESEAKQANFWRAVTVWFFVGSIAIGGAALAFAHAVTLSLTVARVLFAFLILGATIYTGRESARHRSTADRAKRVELELASLGPYMESLDKKKQEELRAKLTDQYFGKEGELHKVENLLEKKDVMLLLRAFAQNAGKGKE
jgi:hypothetical protein